MNMEMMDYVYDSPCVEIIELVPEGVLCGSNEKLEEEWGAWGFVKGLIY